MKFSNPFSTKSSLILFLEYIHKNKGVQKECDVTDVLNGILSKHQSHYEFLEEVRSNGFIKSKSAKGHGISSIGDEKIEQKSIAELTLVGESHLIKYKQDIFNTLLVLISVIIGFFGVITTIYLSK